MNEYLITALQALLLIGGFLDAPYVDVQGAVERALAGKRRRLREFVRTQTVEWSGADSLVRWFHDHGLKFLLKEEVVPSHVDRVFYMAAPCIALGTALIAFAVVPFGPTTVAPRELNQANTSRAGGTPGCGGRA